MFYEAPKDELLHKITHNEHINKFMGEIYSHAYFVHNVFLIHMFSGFFVCIMSFIWCAHFLQAYRCQCCANLQVLMANEFAWFHVHKAWG
jgi:hypothetical protein